MTWDSLSRVTAIFSLCTQALAAHRTAFAYVIKVWTQRALQRLSPPFGTGGTFSPISVNNLNESQIGEYGIREQKS